MAATDMGVSAWLRPPRHLLALFAAVVLLPAAALVWLGWQFFDRDRAFEQQQIRTRLEAAAERVSSELAGALEATARDLPSWLQQPPASIGTDGVLVRISPSGVVAKAGAPLPFVPAFSDSGLRFAAGGDARWIEAESFEYRDHDPEKAARAFKAIAATSDLDTRAMALIATARNLRAIGRREQALETYRALQFLPEATIMGEPAELVGRAAECRLLSELGRSDELMRAAQSIASGLARGRWHIDRATFEMRAAEVQTWTPLATDEDAIARAAAIEWFWSEYRTNSSSAPSGSRSLSSNGRGIMLIWRTLGDEVVAFAAGTAYITRLFQSIPKTEGVAVSLEHVGGNAIKVRAADSGLPWDLSIANTTAPADAANFAAKRRLLGWSLAALVVLIPAGGYLVWRSVHKELAVATLQADFVAAVSHEFRTPLTSMAHLTERLQRDASIPDERKRQYYDVLARDTDRLRRFVETLLDFGRMEAGVAPVHTMAADLTAVVSDVVNEFRTEQAAQQREIVVRSNGVLPPVQLDREAFGRALWNLLENASKYSPVEAPITVSIRREARVACVDVSDRGVGVAQAEQKQIFRKFVRGADSQSSGIKGTGVGLAMVERIIRAHGGSVRLKSVLGEGSTFSLVLPVEGQLVVPAESSQES